MFPLREVIGKWRRHYSLLNARCGYKGRRNAQPDLRAFLTGKRLPDNQTTQRQLERHEYEPGWQFATKDAMCASLEYLACIQPVVFGQYREARLTKAFPQQRDRPSTCHFVKTANDHD